MFGLRITRDDGCHHVYVGPVLLKYKTRPSVRVNWVACLYVLHNTNLGGIESFILNLRIVGRWSRPV